MDIELFFYKVKFCDSHIICRVAAKHGLKIAIAGYQSEELTINLKVYDSHPSYKTIEKNYGFFSELKLYAFELKMNKDETNSD